MVLEDLTRNLVAPRLGAAAQFFGTYALPVSQLANDMRQRSGVAFFSLLLLILTNAFCVKSCTLAVQPGRPPAAASPWSQVRSMLRSCFASLRRKLSARSRPALSGSRALAPWELGEIRPLLSCPVLSSRTQLKGHGLGPSPIASLGAPACRSSQAVQ